MISPLTPTRNDCHVSSSVMLRTELGIAGAQSDNGLAICVQPYALLFSLIIIVAHERAQFVTGSAEKIIPKVQGRVVNVPLNRRQRI